MLRPAEWPRVCSGVVDSQMQKVTVARNQISPLLDQLIHELDAEGASTQKAFFCRVRGHLELAYDDYDLATPIIELSSSLALGFHFSHNANVLVERIQEKAAELVKALEGVQPNFH